jgi:hypothetical protein
MSKHHLRSKQQNTDNYNKAGVYKLKCKTCHMQYIGQTGHTFQSRFKEHIRAEQHNQGSSKYVQHILDTTHSFGTIKKIIEIVKTAKKGKYLDTLEKYYVFCLSQ